MSVCLIVQKKNEIFIGTDTAICSKINDEHIRIGECEDKFFIKNNVGFYCSGKLEIAEQVKEYINSNDIDLIQIINYIKKLDEQYSFEDLDIELIIVSLERCIQISKYNNFQPVEYKIKNNEDMYLISAGFKVSENWHKLYDSIKSKYNPVDNIRNVIKSSVCQEIGGRCKIYHLNKSEFELSLNERVDDITSQNLQNNSWLINAEVVMGTLIAGESLYITNSTGSFLVDSSGATLTDLDLTLDSDDGLNRIYLNTTDGFTIQQYDEDEDEWTDVVYLDEEGNATFDGAIVGGTMNISDNFTVDEDGNVVINGTLDISDKLIVDSTGNLTVEGDITADNFYLYVDGVKTSVLDTTTGKISSDYVTDISTGSAIFKSMIVDQLSTSDKISNYLTSTTDEVNYIFVHDQYIDFYTEDTVSGSEQAYSNADNTGLPIYWVLEDTESGIAANTYITTDVTTSPVMQYTYTNKYKKMQIAFEDVDGVKTPKIILGIGDGVTDESAKAEIYKGTSGLEVNYYASNTGEVRQILLTDDGISIAGNTSSTGLRNIGVGTSLPTSGETNELFILTED
jgi:hypothetical protein